MNLKVRFTSMRNCHSSTEFFRFFSFDYFHAWANILLFRTHHPWNSSTELILLCNGLLLCKTKRNRFGYISSNGKYERVIEKICQDHELKLNSWCIFFSFTLWTDTFWQYYFMKREIRAQSCSRLIRNECPFLNGLSHL